jgi:hypothetical protein
MKPDFMKKKTKPKAKPPEKVWTLEVTVKDANGKVMFANKSASPTAYMNQEMVEMEKSHYHEITQRETTIVIGSVKVTVRDTRDRQAIVKPEGY